MGWFGPKDRPVAFDLTAEVDAANVRMLVWNFGAGPGEGTRDVTLEYTGVGCFDGKPVAVLAARMNPNYPNGAG